MPAPGELMALDAGRIPLVALVPDLRRVHREAGRAELARLTVQAAADVGRDRGRRAWADVDAFGPHQLAVVRLFFVVALLFVIHAGTLARGVRYVLPSAA